MNGSQACSSSRAAIGLGGSWYIITHEMPRIAPGDHFASSPIPRYYPKGFATLSDSAMPEATIEPTPKQAPEKGSPEKN